MHERYEDTPSTYLEHDLDLWFEAFSKPDRNWVYSISNTAIEDLRTGRSVLTVGLLQSSSNSQSPKFQAIVQQVKAQLTRLTAET